MKKAFITTAIIVIFGLVVPPFFAEAASFKIYFGGKILEQLKFSVSVGGHGITLGPLAKIKDDESKKTVYILTVASLGVCKKGGHIVGLGINAKFYKYRYIQPILAFCD